MLTRAKTSNALTDSAMNTEKQMPLQKEFTRKVTPARKTKQMKGGRIGKNGAAGQIPTSTNDNNIMLLASSLKEPVIKNRHSKKVSPLQKIKPERATRKTMNSGQQKPVIPGYGIVEYKLSMPGLFDLVVETQQNTAYFTKVYQAFEGKYWRKSLRLDSYSQHTRFFFDCIICETRFKARTSLLAHLNRHMGLYIGRCTRCPRKYFDAKTFRVHLKQCMST